MVIIWPPNKWHFSFEGHPLLIFAQGCGGRCGCESRVCPQLSPIIHLLLRFVLLTCPKIAEMGWTQTRAPKSSGWSVCQQKASPSASVSHKTSNLFGRQKTWLPLDLSVWRPPEGQEYLVQFKRHTLSFQRGRTPVLVINVTLIRK